MDLNETENCNAQPGFRFAFTLVELLVVISIIAILIGLLFPAFKGVQEQARRTQAKNDLTQIVAAVNAYYNEYGKYPLLDQGADKSLPGDYTQDQLFNVLRRTGTGWDNANGGNLNPKRIVFLNPQVAKDATNPRGGIGSADGKFYDPWGSEYQIRVDGSYDQLIANPYVDSPGGNPLRNGIVVWSFGKDRAFGDKNRDDAKYRDSDDIISWQ